MAIHFINTFQQMLLVFDTNSKMVDSSSYATNVHIYELFRTDIFKVGANPTSHPFFYPLVLCIQLTSPTRSRDREYLLR
jgi:hypothetical protein